MTKITLSIIFALILGSVSSAQILPNRMTGLTGNQYITYNNTFTVYPRNLGFYYDNPGTFTGNTLTSLSLRPYRKTNPPFNIDLEVEMSYNVAATALTVTQQSHNLANKVVVIPRSQIYFPAYSYIYDIYTANTVLPFTYTFQFTNPITIPSNATNLLFTFKVYGIQIVPPGTEVHFEAAEQKIFAFLPAFQYTKNILAMDSSSTCIPNSLLSNTLTSTIGESVNTFTADIVTHGRYGDPAELDVELYGLLSYTPIILRDRITTLQYLCYVGTYPLVTVPVSVSLFGSPIVNITNSIPWAVSLEGLFLYSQRLTFSPAMNDFVDIGETIMYAYPRIQRPVDFNMADNFGPGTSSAVCLVISLQ